MQVAIKTDLGVKLWECRFPVYVAFSEDGRLDSEAFKSTWAGISSDDEKTLKIPNRKPKTSEEVKALVAQHNVLFIAKRAAAKGEVMYFSLSLMGVPVLLEITLNGSKCTYVPASRCI